MNTKKIIAGIIVVSLIIFIILAQSGVLGDRNRESPRGKPNSYSVGQQGFKALYLLFNKMGYKIKRWTNTPDELNAEPDACYIVLIPFTHLVEKGDLKKINNWVGKGNRFLLGCNYENEMMIELKMDLKIGGSPDVPTPRGSLSDNITKLEGLNPVRLKIDKSKHTVLLEDDFGVICASSKQDKGEIIVLSCPEIFSNENINRADNVILASNILKYAGKENVLMDESYHGFAGGKNGKKHFEISPAMRFVLIQLALCLLVFYLVMMRRFGRPRRISEETTRTSTEYIHSLAGLFKKAGTVDFIMENCIRGFKRRVAGTCRLSAEAPDEKFIEAIGYISHDDELAAESALKRCRKTMSEKNVSDATIIGLYREMEKISHRITG